jgi:hypothetical protein
MPWTIQFGDESDDEYRALDEDVQDAVLAAVALLENAGPELGRPFVDTLKGSKYANMKELRFSASRGVWRVAFAFDPSRQAVLMVAGDKARVSQARFYRSLIATADARYTEHLQRLRDRPAQQGH